MGLNAILGGLSGVEGIVNGLGANARLKAAQEARNRMLAQVGSDLQQQYQQTQQGNLQALRRSTGMLGDNLVAQGSDMGSALARAGVSNSSATAGALVKGEAQNAAALQGQSEHNFDSEQNLLSQQKNQLNNMELGNDNFGRPTGVGLNADVLNAQQGAGAAWQGVANLGTSLSSLLQPKAAAPAEPTFGSGAQAAIDQGTGMGQPFPTNTTNPLGLNLGRLSGGALGGMVDPTQSRAQTLTMNAGAGVGNPGVSSIGLPIMNGTLGKPSLINPTNLSSNMLNIGTRRFN